MNRERLPAVLVTLALLALAAWTYSSGSSPVNGALATSTTTTTTAPAEPTTTAATTPTTTATTATTTVVSTTAAVPSTTVTANPQAYATALFRSAGSTFCTWARPKRQMVMQVHNATGGLPILVVALQKHS
jgi:hypothetical protein